MGQHQLAQDLNDLLDCDLNDWEEGFVNDIIEQIEDNEGRISFLSELQENKIEDLVEKYL